MDTVFRRMTAHLLAVGESKYLMPKGKRSFGVTKDDAAIEFEGKCCRCAECCELIRRVVWSDPEDDTLTEIVNVHSWLRDNRVIVRQHVAKYGRLGGQGMSGYSSRLKMKKGSVIFKKDHETLVPEGGLEPPRGCPHWILNPARLPIPPLRLE